MGSADAPDRPGTDRGVQSELDRQCHQSCDARHRADRRQHHDDHPVPARCQLGAHSGEEEHRREHHCRGDVATGSVGGSAGVVEAVGRPRAAARPPLELPAPRIRPSRTGLPERPGCRGDPTRPRRRPPAGADREIARRRTRPDASSPSAYASVHAMNTATSSAICWPAVLEARTDSVRDAVAWLYRSDCTLDQWVLWKPVHAVRTTISDMTNTVTSSSTRSSPADCRASSESVGGIKAVQGRHGAASNRSGVRHRDGRQPTPVLVHPRRVFPPPRGV